MTLSESNSSVFQNYATAKGRASRSEYWWWALSFASVMFIVISLIVNNIISFPLDGLLNLVCLSQTFVLLSVVATIVDIVVGGPFVQWAVLL